jgi:glutamyl-tRNA synthetase
MKKIRTRFAPSPTGKLHIGGIRSALYPYALAKRHGGEFILRIEDTDQKRKVEEGEEEIKKALTAYGIVWDEFYRQSERIEIYKNYAEELIEKGFAYYSFETKEELEKARQKAQDNNEVFHYRSPDRELSLDEARNKIKQGHSYVVRLKTPLNEEIIFEDVVQGKMRFNTNDIDDSILLKSDGFPTYHLAVVVDDHLMEITHVLRGFGWIPSIPKHVLIYRAFGWEMPAHGHITDILNPDGKGKLSKRHGDVAALDFIAQGFLPEAVLNYLMLLGWSSPEERVHGESERELFTLEQFVEIFDIKNLNKSNQRYNIEKLIWFNQKYIQSLSADAFSNKFLSWLELFNNDEDLKKNIINNGPDYLQKILLLEKDRVKTFTQIPDAIDFYYNRPAKSDLLEVKQLKNYDLKIIQNALIEFIESTEINVQSFGNWSHDDWEQSIRTIADRNELKHGALFMALRICVTGSPTSPPLFETMQILGKEESINRIKQYI